MLDAAKYEFAQPAELSDDEMAEVLKLSGELAKWADDMILFT